MPTFCLIPAEADKFLEKLKNGEIDPEKLAAMTSLERRQFLGNIVGERNAFQVNALYESKLLLKDQKRGLVTWAKKVAGLTEPQRTDLITKIQKLERVLNPAEEKKFLSDLAEQKLGVAVTPEEAKTIFELSKKAQELRLQADPKTFKFGDETKSRFGYEISKKGLESGIATRRLENYMNALKIESDRMPIKDYLLHPLENKTLKRVISTIPDLAISLKAAFDNSFFGRQGRRVMIRGLNPISSSSRQFARTFWGQLGDSFRKIVKVNFSRDPLLAARALEDAEYARIYSMPEYLSGEFKTAKILSDYNEQFPTNIPSRIPIIRRPYIGSEVTFKLSNLHTRIDIYKIFKNMDVKRGIANTNEEIISRGKLVNSMVGLSDFGAKNEAAVRSPLVKTLIWAPKLAKSHVDHLTIFAGQEGVTPTMRKHAAGNLLFDILGTAAMLYTIHKINPNLIEFDPRSSDFGKIKVGNTRIDITGGFGAILILAARIASNSYIDSDGIVHPLNSGAFSKSGTDLLMAFMGNKVTPAAQVMADLINRKDRNGKPLTIFGEVKTLFMPLPLVNIQELAKDPNSAGIIGGAISDFFGAATNTYGSKDTINPNQVYDAISGDDIGNNYQLINSFVQRGATKDDLTKLLDQYYKEHPVKDGKATENRKAQQKSLSQMLSAYSAISKTEFRPNDKAPKDIWSAASLGLRGIVKDPENTLRALFTKERLQEVYGDVATFQREDYLGLLDKGNKGTQIDHKIALALGGDNSPQNLQVLSNDENKVKGELEAYLTKLLRDGKIKKAEAQSIDKQWKDYVDMERKKVLKDKISVNSNGANNSFLNTDGISKPAKAIQPSTIDKVTRIAITSLTGPFGALYSLINPSEKQSAYKTYNFSATQKKETQLTPIIPTISGFGSSSSGTERNLFKSILPVITEQVGKLSWKELLPYTRKVTPDAEDPTTEVKDYRLSLPWFSKTNEDTKVNVVAHEMAHNIYDHLRSTPLANSQKVKLESSGEKTLNDAGARPRSAYDNKFIDDFHKADPTTYNSIYKLLTTNSAYSKGFDLASELYAYGFTKYKSDPRSIPDRLKKYYY